MPGTLTGLPQQVPQLGDVRRLALPTRLDCIQCDRDYHEDQKDGSSIAHAGTRSASGVVRFACRQRPQVFL